MNGASIVSASGAVFCIDKAYKQVLEAYHLSLLRLFVDDASREHGCNRDADTTSSKYGSLSVQPIHITPRCLRGPVLYFYRAPAPESMADTQTISMSLSCSHSDTVKCAHY